MNDKNCGAKNLLSSNTFFALGITLTVAIILALISFALNPTAIYSSIEPLEQYIPEWLPLQTLVAAGIIAEGIMLIGLWLTYFGASNDNYKLTRVGFIIMQIVLSFYVVFLCAYFIYVFGWNFCPEFTKTFLGVNNSEQKFAILLLFLLVLWIMIIIFAAISAYFIYSAKVVGYVDKAYTNYKSNKISAVFFYIFVAIAPILILIGGLILALGWTNGEMEADLIVSSISNIVSGIAYFLVLALISKYNKNVKGLGDCNSALVQDDASKNVLPLMEEESENIADSVQGETEDACEEILQTEIADNNNANAVLPSATVIVNDENNIELTENKKVKKIGIVKIGIFVAIIVALVAVLATTLIILNIHPNEYVANGVIYKLNAESKTYSVIGYKQGRLPKDGVVEIEADRFGYAVVSIEEYAFFQCSEITGVIIPEGVEEIDSYAFTTCQNLRYVVMPSTIEIMHQWTVTNNPNVNVYLQKESVLWSEDWWFGSFDGDVYYLGQWHYNSDGVPVPN